MNINAILQKDFGFAAFKEGEKTIIEAIIRGRDVPAVIPTGDVKLEKYDRRFMVAIREANDAAS